MGRKVKIGQNYTTHENIMRILWGGASFFFRYSPRLLYGWRNFLLRIFGAKIGKNVKIYPSAKIMFPWKLEIGEGVVISWDVILYNLGKIIIQDYAIISQNAHLCAGTHDYDSKNFRLQKKQIVICQKVWIAADAFVGPGVIVGKRSIVGARAVVTKDVSPDTIVIGNPAVLLKKRNKRIEGNISH